MKLVQNAHARHATLLLLPLTLALPQLSFSQTGTPGERPSIEAARLPDGSELRIDGRLDENVWALATPIVEFRQTEPEEGGTPTERTEIRILYDAGALYIGAMLYDSNPNGILAHQLQRDIGLGTDDRFMWILDTFRDGRTGYFFETNPAGLMGDGLLGGGFGPGAGVNKSWDGIWEVRTQIGAEGWAVEVRIPFSTMNFDPDRDVWGINFQRTVRRRNEEILWSGWLRNESLFRPANAGTVTGITGISQGLGIEAKPFFSASGNQSIDQGDPWDGDAKTGLDLTYSLTPSLRAAVTLNTDFAEVEVDQRRVNLTRFPLRFPERRDFFLEGSSVFSFPWADPFFSRRIGLVEGQEVPIRVGARLAGQVGRNEIGFYQIRTGEAPPDVPGSPSLMPPEDFTVARVRHGLFEQSHIGGVYTRRATEVGKGGLVRPDRHTVGVDADFFTSRALGRYNAQIDAFMVYHSDPVNGGDLLGADRRARGVRINFPNDLIRVHHSYRDFGAGWDPPVGFTQRRAYRRHQPTFILAPRPDRWEAIRQLEWELRFEYLTDLENQLLTRYWDMTLFNINFESGDNFQSGVRHSFERLLNPFTIFGSGDEAIIIPTGDYDGWSWSTNLNTASRRMISGSVNAGWSQFWSGARQEIGLRGTIRPWRGTSFSADYELNRVRLTEGDFDTNLFRLSTSWSLNPQTSLTSNIQYDDLSQVIGLFARLRWIVRPGSDLFVVWTNNWRNSPAAILDPRRELVTLSRGLAMKVNYSFRF